MSAPQAPPRLDLGGQGDILHFSHANGYPPLTYQALFTALQDSHKLSASLHRPLWVRQPEDMPDWAILGRDLAQVVEDHGKPVVGVGHSMGASALVLAAARRPELFRALILIEPVLVRPIYSYLLNMLRPVARSRVPFIRATVKRTDSWPDKDAVFAHFRAKPVFARISDDVLWDYVEYGTSEKAGRRVLTYDKYWEVHCYLRIHNLWPHITQLQVPVLGIRGQQSDTLPEQQWQAWRARTEHDFVQMADCGHLLPFEVPDKVAATIRQWLQSLAD